MHDAMEARLQLVGYLSSALSLSGTLYVLGHFGYAHLRLEPPLPSLPLQFQRSRRRRVDFMDQLVLVLALFDLVTIAARAVGRGVVHDDALCKAQAAVIQAGNLASCIWICCMAYNLYRWIAGGESDATRRRRFPLFLAVAVVPGAGFVVFHLLTNKYGDATFYCWLGEIRLMFLNFYLFYVLMIVFNFVLLALIHFNMKQRVARHDTVEADTSSMLIRRKLLLYIVVFVAHRTPMMIYRSKRAKEGPPPREHEAESVSSPTESLMGGYVVKKRTAVVEDDHEAIICSSTKIGTTLTQSGRKISCESDSGDSSADRNTQSRKMMVQEEHNSSYRTWQQRLQKRFSLHHTPPPVPVEPRKIAIFASTFNMGEKDVNEHELREWIPLGQDVYVIGVQECMDLNDLQFRILRHLVSGSTGKYVHYSREIGKRATALGYHGYIALCIFVRATAVASGRFRMPHRQSSNKNAQEVFRGKSLLLFGRASNKGAVGMSFRFDDTSFAFVTCHLASDSSSLKRAKRKKSAYSVLQTQKGGDISVESNLNNNSGSVARSSDGDSAGSKNSVSDGITEAHQPPSKVERRNQDAMEILQQLYLDEEDYGFGFPHLHHHSFILGDFNYRMTRKGATPMDMLELLVNAGSEHHQTCENVYTMDLSSPCSPAILQTSASEISHDEGDFRQCITPKVQSPTPIAVARKSTRHVRGRAGTSTSNSGSSSAPFLLRTLVEEHDELYQLFRSQQLFHGFQENEINFFPTFRRIRGQSLREPLDAVAFQQNYSLVAAHGGYRVPSYTDRIFYSSLSGMRDSLRCLSYDSCEAVTSSDHKPVSASFEVSLLASTQTPSAVVTEDSLWNANSTDANPMILRDPSAGIARMKDVPGACELRLRIEFRSIHWIDAVDSALFDRAEHMQFGFLFPLPCEDVFAPQRKLHEVAEHLTFGGGESGNTGGMGFASTITPTSNFHTLKWHEFVNGGLRYHTMAGAVGRKHVAVVLRSLGRGRSMSKTSSASRLLGGSCPLSPHTSNNSIASTCSPTPHNSSVGSSSSFFSETLFGHGTFCAEGMTRKRDVCVPLTLGGKLLGRLQLRVSLQMRQKK
ncbi:Transmembrane protein [Phytophthora megakarya]|uniref:Transmembrane protein n=1 Tax=Phytophthora megakarya TaxID=4795 RepID=A0A225X1E1_9STRA|nr:Transmembrane protein [Phytophthora megakarya]